MLVAFACLAIFLVVNWSTTDLVLGVGFSNFLGRPLFLLIDPSAVFSSPLFPSTSIINFVVANTVV